MLFLAMTDTMIDSYCPSAFFYGHLVGASV